MESQALIANFIKTICWKDNTIVDWAQGGQQYLLDGGIKQIGKYHFPFSFNSAISSANGDYVFIYQKLGTKGLLLKNGEIIKEINRSYYCANSYEFPAAFITSKDKTYLVHCPIAYNQLDFEDVETGQLITNIQNRKPDDYFHSRLEVSPDGTYLMSKGWLWHPLDWIMVFNVNDCINNPALLDTSQFFLDVGAEICTASFVDNNMIIIGSSDEIINEDETSELPPKHICLWDLKVNKLSKPVEVKEDFGNLFAIDNNYVWDMVGHPKIIDINTGVIIDRNEEINSGKQRSSLISNTDNYPSIIFNRGTGQIAIKADEEIKVLTLDHS